MKRSALMLGGVAAILGAALLVYGVLKEQAGQDVAPQVMACADLTQGCSLPGLKVQALQTPSAMHAFTVEVEAEADKVEARFEMRDMSMGLNHYRFLAKGQGHWQASVILPLCIDGRSDWLMLLDITSSAGKLQRYQLAFTAPADPNASGHQHHDMHHGH